MSAGSSFSEALRAMRSGYRVTRTGWGGKDVFLFLLSDLRTNVHMPSRKPLAVSDSGPISVPVRLEPFLVLCAENGTFVPWIASQTDLLAMDWDTV